MFQFQGANLIPGIKSALETVENQFWVGRYENQIWTQEVVLAATTDTGNTNQTTDLRAGLLLGKIKTGTGAGKVTVWNPAATNGSQVVYGVLGTMVNTDFRGTTADRFIGFIMVGGQIDPNKILVPGQTALGIAANANRYMIQSQLHPRFLFSKDYEGVRLGGWKDIQAKTANYTVTLGDADVLFTTRGAAGTVTFTLPTVALKGLRYGFYNVANQNMIVAAGTADTLTVFNNAEADSAAFQTTSQKVGGFMEVIGDGTTWLLINHVGAITQTTTIVDA
jgi:hypothetical protein